MTTAVQLAQSVAPGVSLGFKNRIINGAMMIDQRNAGASVSNPNGKYAVDRFSCQTYRSSSTAQQVQDAPSGLYYSVKYTNDGTGGAPSAGNTLCFVQGIEGYNVEDLAYGTSSALTTTLSFWVKSSVTGTYGIGITNGSSVDSWYTATRSYVATYTVNSASTWEYKTVTIPGCTDGTWGKTNGVGIDVVFDMGSGSTYETTAGSWANGGYNRTSACVKLGSTASATWQVTGVQLEVGTTATPFEFRDYGRELIMCQRYYYQTNKGAQYAYFGSGTNWSGTSSRFFVTTPVPLRTTPAVTVIGTLSASGYGASGGQDFSSTTAGSVDAQTNGVCQVSFFLTMSGTFGSYTGLTLKANDSSSYIVFSSEL